MLNRFVKMIGIRPFLPILFLAVIAVAPAGPYANAQTLYGTLVGTVKDSSGAMVPDATVTVVQKTQEQSLPTAKAPILCRRCPPAPT